MAERRLYPLRVFLFDWAKLGDDEVRRRVEGNFVNEVCKQVMHCRGWTLRSIMSESCCGHGDEQLIERRVVHLEVQLGWVALEEVLRSAGRLFESISISLGKPLPIIHRGRVKRPDPLATEVDQGCDAARARQ